MAGCDGEFASYAHGSKGSAVISQNGHWPSRARMFKNQDMRRENLIWSFGKEENDPYAREWEHLFQAIREDKPYNEVPRGVEASLATSMGRMACHTGKTITRDEMLACDHEFAPNIDDLGPGKPAPLVADENGKYPVPMPGLIGRREYQ